MRAPDGSWNLEKREWGNQWKGWCVTRHCKSQQGRQYGSRIPCSRQGSLACPRAPSPLPFRWGSCTGRQLAAILYVRSYNPGTRNSWGAEHLRLQLVGPRACHAPPGGCIDRREIPAVKRGRTLSAFSSYIRFQELLQVSCSMS